MLRELFGHTQEECHKMAETVDTQGKVVVLTTTKEHAELKRDQILAYGKDDLIDELQRLDARDDRIGGVDADCGCGLARGSQSDPRSNIA